MCVCVCINSSHCCRQAHSSWHTQKVMPRLDKTSPAAYSRLATHLPLQTPLTCSLPVFRQQQLINELTRCVDKRYVPLSPYNHEHGFWISWLESHRQRGQRRRTVRSGHEEAIWAGVGGGDGWLQSRIHFQLLVLLAIVVVVGALLL